MPARPLHRLGSEQDQRFRLPRRTQSVRLRWRNPQLQWHSESTSEPVTPTPPGRSKCHDRCGPLAMPSPCRFERGPNESPKSLLGSGSGDSSLGVPLCPQAASWQAPVWSDTFVSVRRGTRVSNRPERRHSLLRHCGQSGARADSRCSLRIFASRAHSVVLGNKRCLTEALPARVHDRQSGIDLLEEAPNLLFEESLHNCSAISARLDPLLGARSTRVFSRPPGREPACIPAPPRSRRTIRVWGPARSDS